VRIWGEEKQYLKAPLGESKHPWHFNKGANCSCNSALQSQLGGETSPPGSSSGGFPARTQQDAASKHRQTVGVMLVRLE